VLAAAAQGFPACHQDVQLRRGREQGVRPRTSPHRRRGAWGTRTGPPPARARYHGPRDPASTGVTSTRRGRSAHLRNRTPASHRHADSGGRASEDRPATTVGRGRLDTGAGYRHRPLPGPVPDTSEQEVTDYDDLRGQRDPEPGTGANTSARGADERRPWTDWCRSPATPRATRCSCSNPPRVGQITPPTTGNILSGPLERGFVTRNRLTDHGLHLSPGSWSRRHPRDRVCAPGASREVTVSAGFSST
jgi:hypothetical protein